MAIPAPHKHSLQQRSFFFFPPLFLSNLPVPLVCQHFSIWLQGVLGGGSAESEVKCAQVWHENNQRLGFLRRVSRGQGWRRVFRSDLMLWCKGYATWSERKWCVVNNIIFFPTMLLTFYHVSFIQTKGKSTQRIQQLCHQDDELLWITSPRGICVAVRKPSSPARNFVFWCFCIFTILQKISETTASDQDLNMGNSVRRTCWETSTEMLVSLWK